jgi:LCP family protein required for cell wall assembly
MADDEKPDYRVYRSRPRFLKGRETASPREGIDDLREQIPRPEGQPEYRVHRGGKGGSRIPRPRLPGRRAGKLAARFTIWRLLRYLVYFVIGWTLLSALLFMISAQIQSQGVDERAGDALTDSGYTLTTPNTILILGSDARTEETSEPGSQVGGPGRSDSILLMRAGGGKSARLSIPRDTVVDIPGHGRQKINAAYAIGGAELAIKTIQQYLGTPINHLVEVNFENFPEFIDAMGGITVRTGCVRSKINGGFRNGGYTLRLGPGEHHINGRQALALARTRKNDCKPSENDLTRARRQQKILAAIRGRLFSPGAFIRLPWVSWKAPQAIRSDMGGPQLLGLFAAVATSGTPPTRILGDVQADGSVGISEEEKRAAVEQFLDAS